MRIYPFNDTRARLTWESEGNPDPLAEQFNMFVPHKPSEKSGLTICGYDGWQNRETILGDLMSAGAFLPASYRGSLDRPNPTFDEFNTALGLALEYLGDKLLMVGTRLFEIAYDRIEANMRRIIKRPCFIQKYGEMPEIPVWAWEIFVDLGFRGDNTPASREEIVPPMIDQDWRKFARKMDDRELWPNVPQDRFDRRADYAHDSYVSMQPTHNPSLAIAKARLKIQEADSVLAGIGE